jgi:glycosyltransferase involved in cell wall biosynthesis
VSFLGEWVKFSPLDMTVLLYVLLSLALALAYLSVQFCYRNGWRRLPAWTIPAGWRPGTFVTVVVPARNEAAHIAACLQSIVCGTYPAELLEILVVDDHSEDDTAVHVRQFAAHAPVRIRLLELSGTGVFGKKKAIERAVAEASGTLIATTDADCVAPPDWLRLLVSLHEIRRPGAITAPVAIHREQNLLQRFQALDLAGMMGITGGGLWLGWHTMGNGANLCYAKTQFLEVRGFAGSEHLASGDDFFLLQKIAHRAPVLFLKNAAATVYTEALADVPAFFRQRLRWGTKSPALPDWGAKLALGLVLLHCGAVLVSVVLVLTGLAPPGLLAAQLVLKALADYLLLREMCGFFRRPALLRWFWPAFFLHTLYIAAIGSASLIRSQYTWKGRRLR